MLCLCFYNLCIVLCVIYCVNKKKSVHPDLTYYDEMEVLSSLSLWVNFLCHNTLEIDQTSQNVKKKIFPENSLVSPCLHHESIYCACTGTILQCVRLRLWWYMICHSVFILLHITLEYIVFNIVCVHYDPASFCDKQCQQDGYLTLRYSFSMIYQQTSIFAVLCAILLQSYR